jgi:glycosyltransferase involved in cell wall biosynthesis
VHIALVAPPFIPVPPITYGGTELFIALLAAGLVARGHDVIVYANGASKVSGELRWCYPEADWPPRPEAHSALKSIDHGTWSLHDAFEEDVDIVHLNDAIHLPVSRFLGMPIVQTLHHPHEPELTSLYARFPDVTYVAISESQRLAEPLARISTIHHGIQLNEYTYQAEKDDYVCFLGRMAPVKAPHLAIEAARRAGVRIKLAGEIQPVFQEYWDKEVSPLIDGRVVEYVGEADQQTKNDLLANSQALLFPIQWEEPFGLVMVEAMACGTPVLAFPTGSVPEVIVDGINGRICDDLDEMAEWARDPRVDPADCRRHVERYFSLDVMVDAYEALYRTLVGGSCVPQRHSA